MNWPKFLKKVTSYIKPVDNGSSLSTGPIKEDERILLGDLLKQEIKITSSLVPESSPVDRIEFDQSVVRFKLKEFPDNFQLVNIAQSSGVAIYNLKCRKTGATIIVPVTLFRKLFEKVKYE